MADARCIGCHAVHVGMARQRCNHRARVTVQHLHVVKEAGNCMRDAIDKLWSHGFESWLAMGVARAAG